MPDCVVCGCPHELHTHLRDGSDCGKCRHCRAYKQPPGRILRWVERLLG